MIHYKVKARLVLLIGTDDFSYKEVEKIFTNKKNPIEARKEAYSHYESYLDVIEADSFNEITILNKLMTPFVKHFEKKGGLPSDFPKSLGIGLYYFSDNEDLLSKKEDYFIMGWNDYSTDTEKNLELEKRIYDKNKWDTQNWITTIKYYDLDKHTLNTIYVEDPNAVILSEVLWCPTDFWSHSNPSVWAADDDIWAEEGQFLLDVDEEVEKKLQKLELQKIQESLLLKIIREGENQNLEFKSTFRFCLRQKSKQPYVELEILKTIAAFANTNGGTLLIGVADDGKVLGLENDFNIYKDSPKDKFLKHFANVIKAGFTEPIDAIIKYEFDKSLEKEVFLVMVEKSNKPRFLNSRGEEKEFYIRRTATSQKLNVEEAVKYSIDKWYAKD
ncbi:helix-turn-helix domain-containing protein [Gelidibacter japonicus]|uniref:AlbA family DNA-binding domain-containing protein n=1 Tax=Gelidibacter japonicus TaxID=1962232 RepID=UPI003A939853